MRVIDLDKWKRASHYKFYSRFNQPYYAITAQCDITQLHNYCKKHASKIAPAYLYASQCAVHNTEEFTYRILDDQVVAYDRLYAGPTIALPDETFRFSLIDMKDSYPPFLQKYLEEAERVSQLPELNPGYTDLDIIYYTTIPWISFTSMNNPHNLHGETIPRISFGKFHSEGNRVMLPVCVEVHHGLVDGRHIGQYFEYFEHILQTPETLLA